MGWRCAAAYPDLSLAALQVAACTFGLRRQVVKWMILRGAGKVSHDEECDSVEV